MAAPKDKADLSRFLGMVTYLAKFIPNLSSECNALRKLTHDDADFVWTNTSQGDLDLIKKLITSVPVLQYFDAKKPVTIQSDASEFALGACIMQNGLPISYASKVLTKTQRNYAQIEKELLSIVFACRRFDQYICGKPDVFVETDHQPLIRIATKQQLSETPKRLQAMLMSLQRYQLKLKYVKGCEMHIADFLSRAPEESTGAEKQFEIYQLLAGEDIELVEFDQINALEDVPVRDKQIKRIREATLNDPVLQQLRKTVIDGWPNEKRDVQREIEHFWNFRDDLSVCDNILLKSNRIVIPLQLQRDILERLHSGHQGIEYTMRLARQTVFWPGMNDQIKNKIRSCPTCLKYAPAQRNPPMTTHDVPSLPFERVSLDVFETNINEKKRRFLITVDHYSDFFEIDDLKDLTAKETIIVCKRNFSRHGIPTVCVVDGGTNFTSQQFKSFAAQWEFQIEQSSPHHHQANAKPKRP